MIRTVKKKTGNQRFKWYSMNEQRRKCCYIFSSNTRNRWLAILKSRRPTSTRRTSTSNAQHTNQPVGEKEKWIAFGGEVDLLEIFGFSVDDVFNGPLYSPEQHCVELSLTRSHFCCVLEKSFKDGLHTSGTDRLIYFAALPKLRKTKL